MVQEEILKPARKRQEKLSVPFTVAQKEHNSWDNDTSKRQKLVSSEKYMIMSSLFRKNHSHVLCSSFRQSIFHFEWL